MNKRLYVATYGWQMGAVLQTADGSHGIGLDVVGGVRKRYLDALGGGGGVAGSLSGIMNRAPMGAVSELRSV